MKVENVEKAIDLLHEYYHTDELLKKSKETQAAVVVLFDKIRKTNIDAEQFQYRKEIVDNIQRLLSYTHHTYYIFETDVFKCGLDVAVINLEYKLKRLKQQIEKL